MMKKYIFAIVVALATTFATVSVNAQVQTSADGSTVKRVKIAGSEFSEESWPFAWKFRGQDTHQTFMTTSDGKSWWSGETIEGWHVGVLGGGTQDGWLAGATFGYSGKKFDVDVTVRASQVSFYDQKYAAPSAFFEFKPTLFKWGKYESNKMYAGARVGYQYARTTSIINESGNVTNSNGDVTGDYEFYREAKLQGSGLAYGAVIGWEKLNFMSGHRYGVQLAAYTYDVEWVNNNNQTMKQGWVVEATFVWKFVFHKKAKNF